MNCVYILQNPGRAAKVIYLFHGLEDVEFVK